MITLEIVRFCAVECEMQQSGEVSVYNMISAWDWAQTWPQRVKLSNGKNILSPPTLKDIMHIGAIIEPKWNSNGFRQVDVRVGWDIKMPWNEVHTAMNDLMTGLDADIYTPAQFFYRYEEIHPWRDGNGRSGQLLFNWLNGTLDDPVWAPDYWQDSRRRPGYGA